MIEIIEFISMSVFVLICGLILYSLIVFFTFGIDVKSSQVPMCHSPLWGAPAKNVRVDNCTNLVCSAKNRCKWQPKT